MKRLFLAAIVSFCISEPLRAANAALAVTSDGRQLIEASGAERRIIVRDSESLRERWSAPGTGNPASIGVSPDDSAAAILDTGGDSVGLLDLARQRSARIAIRRPTAAIFDQRSVLYVLSSSESRLTRVSGTDMASVELPHDPRFITFVQDALVVYCRVTGALVEIDPPSMKLRRTATAPRFAADLETDGRYLYLVLPREGKVAVIDAETFTERERIAVGAVPADVALQRRPGALSAAVLAVADPSSKAIWRVEGSQSSGEAFARGFVRGLLGLGLYKPSSAAYPSGVDRLIDAGGEILAYDSSSRTLYHRERVLSRGVEARAIAAANGSAYLIDTSGRLQRVGLKTREVRRR